MNFSLKQLLHIVGGVLGFFGVAFVVVKLNAYAGQIDLKRFGTMAWLLVGLLAITYGAANLMLVQAWRHLLAFFDAKVEWSWSVKTYGQSQLAKYVPGNIFHLASRQALGMAEGVPAGALAKSALWELGLLVVAGSFLAFLAVPLVLPAIPVFFSIVVFFLLSVGVSLGLHRFFSPTVTFALLWQVLFLAVSGMVFLGVLKLVAPSVVTFSTVSTLCGAYVIAWLAGMVTPGAPAGVGVREFVLLYLLGGQIAQVDLLLAVLLGRIITVAGDFFFFAAASFLKRSPLHGPGRSYLL